MANGTRKAYAGIALGVMLTGSPILAASGPDRPRVTLRLLDLAHVDSRTVEAATAIVTRVFQDAGVDVEWRSGSPMPERVLNGPIRDLRVVIQSARFTARMVALRRSVMGASEGSAVQNAGSAQIYYANIVAFADERQQNLATILGFVISHEIGHLLLPARGHSIRGLMRAHWGALEIRAMAEGSMYFTAKQKDQIRTLLRRNQRIPIR